MAFSSSFMTAATRAAAAAKAAAAKAVADAAAKAKAQAADAGNLNSIMLKINAATQNIAPTTVVSSPLKTTASGALATPSSAVPASQLPAKSGAGGLIAAAGAGIAGLAYYLMNK